MSITIDIRKEFSDGNPILFLINRPQPYIIGSMRVAHSGKVALVKTATGSDEGKPLLVRYRLARKTHLDAWKALVGGNPFNTTTLASYFDLGYNVIFNIANPFTVQGEVIQEFDTDQTIFDSLDGDYRKGQDLFSGVLNLIVTSTV